MKFKDPKTGEVFEDFKSAYENFCKDKECWSCKLPNAINKTTPDGKCCAQYATKNQLETLAIMGYEVIEDDTVAGNTNVPANSDKPLSEWTLGEVKQYCVEHTKTSDKDYDMVCAGCKFNTVCSINADEWQLCEKPVLTEDELTICRALGAKWVSREEDWPYTVMLWDTQPKVAEYQGKKSYEGRIGEPLVIADIRPDKFPSVKPGDCICVEEVIANA